MQVWEYTTEANFRVEDYIKANSDIAAYVAGGGDARKHFETHGRFEKRRQITRQFAEEYAVYSVEKFARLRHVLQLGSDWSFPLGDDRFPVLAPGGTFSMADYSAESAGGTFGEFRADIAENPDAIFLDLGAGLRNEVFLNCLYLEVYPSATTDIIAAAHGRYPIADSSLDGIGCFAVLEHVFDPWFVADEIHRMLKPGGKLYVDWPFLQPVHGYPSHFYNATREGLRSLFEAGFEIGTCDTQSWQDPAFTIHWILNAALTGLPEAEREKVKAMQVGELIEGAPSDPFWRELMLKLDPHTTEQLACGNLLRARKSGPRALGDLELRSMMSAVAKAQHERRDQAASLMGAGGRKLKRAFRNFLGKPSSRW